MHPSKTEDPEPDHADPALAGGAFRCTRAGRIVEVSPALGERIGVRDPGSLEGRSLEDLVDPPEAAQAWLDTVESTGVTPGTVLEMVGPTGDRVKARTLGVAIRDAEGHTRFIEGMLDPGEDIEPAAGGEHGIVDPMDALEWLRSVLTAADIAELGIAIARRREGDEARLLFINEAGGRLLGHDASTLVGKEAKMLFDPGEYARLEEIEPPGLGQGTRLKMEIERPDGEERVIDASIAGGLYHGERASFAFFRDVTEEENMRSALRQQERYYRQLAERSPVPKVLERGGKIVFANTAFAELLGSPDPSSVLGLSLVDLVDDGSVRERLERLRADPGGGSVQRFEATLQRSICPPADVEITAVSIPMTDGPALLAVLDDQTARKRFEAKRERWIEELERSNEALEAFAQAVSHDLKEPLRMVSGHLDVLSRRAASDLTEEAQVFLESAQAGAERLSAMVDGLLELSRLRAEPVEPEPVSVDAALASAIANLSVRIDEAGAEIEHARMGTVLASGTHLAQVLQNLIENAIKYQGEDHPRIEIWDQPASGGRIIHVQDNCRGMEPYELEQAFDLFYRLRTEDEPSGSGIGLALCKQIVESYGGWIEADSEPGQGSTFHIFLPSPGTEPQQGARKAPPRQGTSD